jgi:uncharacterized membrane protein YccC
MYSIHGLRYRLAHFDPGLAELRRAAAAMAAVLACYGSSLLIEHLAGLHLDVVVLAIVLAMTTARIQRAADLTDRLAGLVVLLAAALAASGISRLMSACPDAGDALFVASMFASIWVRRFGQRATRAGTLIVAPLVAVLIMPPSGLPGPGTLWVALIAFIAWFWVTVLQLLAARTGLAAPPRTAPAGPAASAGTRGRVPASTRMALQMAAALAAAFAVGRTAWPSHWAWTVLTAFIVCSGARSRGDVVLKGALRGAGAAAGTVVATAIAGTFGPHADASVAVMFAALAVATWLREFSYAWWAACVTAVLSLLYGWLGQPPGGLLETRLEGIAAGAALGIAASWLILPIRTRDVARRRTADALATLGELLAADWHDPAALHSHQIAFRHAVTRLGQIAPALRAQRLLLSPLRASRSPALRPADAIDAIEHSEFSARALVSAAAADRSATADPCIRQLNEAVAANITAARRAIGRRPGAAYQAAIPGTCPALARDRDGGTGTNHHKPASHGKVLQALAGIDTALATVCFAYGAPQAPPARPTASADPRARDE